MNISKLQVAAFLLFKIGSTYASGVVPNTSVAIVNETDGEGTMIVRNTDDRPTLLYTKIIDLNGTPKGLVVATPAMARIEANGSQLVRFILNSDTPLDKEYLDRVTFEGIPPANPGETRVQTIFRQDLPLIVHPHNLPKMDRPWRTLTASLSNGEVRLCNPSRYVVRLDQRIALPPGNGVANITRNYLLPGEVAIARVSGPSSNASMARIFPGTVYGYIDKSFDIPFTDRCTASTVSQQLE
ncbi:fimbria/pilus chaperone family protein [Burkholderia cepacia]|uniref:fimbria/pilus chaperone family protein n=1 Tax=Burkholderia cepacia TaxID=292 RepID=UPI002ABD56BD|nr:fimbria/pilus chaperone family protein [Burkholderia cepacia]